MPKRITDKRYPNCSRLNVLRQVRKDAYLVVSTAALHNAIGWEAYQRYLPVMKYYQERGGNTPGPTPDSAEQFLKGMK